MSDLCRYDLQHLDGKVSEGEEVIARGVLNDTCALVVAWMQVGDQSQHPIQRPPPLLKQA